MCMCACMHVHLYTCVFVHLRACMHACAYMWLPHQVFNSTHVSSLTSPSVRTILRCLGGTAACVSDEFPEAAARRFPPVVEASATEMVYIFLRISFFQIFFYIADCITERVEKTEWAKTVLEGMFQSRVIKQLGVLHPVNQCGCIRATHILSSHSTFCMLKLVLYIQF